MTPPHARRAAFAFFFAGLALVTASRSSAAPPLHANDGELHGSQGASSEWLPIFLGASAGVIVGGFAGTALDPNQPPTWGGVAGGVIGGVTGGAAGAWIIRSAREQDTRLAGGLCGLGIGAGVAAALFANDTRVGARVLAIAIVPTMGWFAGRSLAIHGMAKDRPLTSAVALAEVRPDVVPIVPIGGAGGGLTIGVNGAFF